MPWIDQTQQRRRARLRVGFRLHDPRLDEHGAARGIDSVFQERGIIREQRTALGWSRLTWLGWLGG